MALTDANPTIIGQELVQVLEKSLVSAAVCNRSYEGEVRDMGSAVKICGVSALSSANYTGSVSYSALDVTSATMNIDIARYVAFDLDDVNATQSAPDLWTPYVQNAGYTLASYIDSKVLEEAGTNAGNNSYRTGTTAWTAGSSGAYIPKMFADIHAKLDAANVPQANRYVIVNPSVRQGLQIWAAGKDSQFASGVQQNGFMGQFMGLNVFVSNNLDADGSSQPQAVAGSAGLGIALVVQLTKSEIVRRDAAFADAYRALVLAGTKAYQTAALVRVILSATFLSDI